MWGRYGYFLELLCVYNDFITITDVMHLSMLSRWGGEAGQRRGI